MHGSIIHCIFDVSKQKVMTKQQKINRLEKFGYRVQFLMSGGVSVGKNQMSRNWYRSINSAYKAIFK